MDERLGLRALNRATLERQLLLGRSTVPALEAVERLAGLQAQEPADPYTALWSRLDGFRTDDLAGLLLERRVVRLPLMRSTVHLVSADDALMLRPLVQPVLDAELRRHPLYAPTLHGVDLDRVLGFARELLAEPRSNRELRAALAQRFPEHDAAALAYACRNHLALVQVPPRGVWGRSGQVTTATIEAWLGRPLAARSSLDGLVLRYLAAFGPATPADAAAWSRLTSLREVVDRLRPQLRTFRDEQGRELVDLPDAPRPDPDTPAPARILPEYDNVLLSHADRSRLVPADVRAALGRVEGRVLGSVLHDGFLAGVWQLERAGAATVFAVTAGRTTSKRASAEIAAEARRYVRFAFAPDAPEVRVRVAA